jgi:transmembrane sensor
MSRLQFPLKDYLREPSDEHAISRAWREIDARFPARKRAGRGPRAIALFAGLATVIALVVHFRREHGPLLLADGHTIVGVEGPASGSALAFSDGSHIELGGGARFEPLESSGSSFVAVLERGSATFDVRPGGPRRWQVECGLATVEVVGTRFSCDRGPGRLRVSVQRGAVLVRGERVPDRVRRLTAGESLDVVAPPEQAAAQRVVSPVPVVQTLLPSGTSPDVPVPAIPPAGDGSKLTWRQLAVDGRDRQAFEILGPQGFRHETRRLGVADLLLLADVARLSGHPEEAVVPLDRILTEFDKDPQAPLAGFALGRLELDALGRPRLAAAALRRALALGMPRSLKEDAQARLFDAYARANDARAVPAARAYLDEFPDGRYKTAIEDRLARSR